MRKQRSSSLGFLELSKKFLDRSIGPDSRRDLSNLGRMSGPSAVVNELDEWFVTTHVEFVVRNRFAQCPR